MLLRMRDFLTLKVGSEQTKPLLEFQDSKRTDLLVRIDATHSGLIIGNGRFYRPDLMKRDIHTWLPKPDRAPVPVIQQHAHQSSEIFGRVLEADYIDLGHNYFDSYPALKNTFFYGQGANRMNLFDSARWIEKNLHSKEDYRGLGKIRLGVKITHPEAIRKIDQEEFLSVSVGFTTDCAYCSVCHTDWARDGKCKHAKNLGGRDSDGNRIFLITGSHKYQEISFVNFPADPFAQVVSKAALTDMIDSVSNRVFFYGLSEPRRESILQMCDSIIPVGADIEPVSEYESGIEEQPNMKPLTDMLVEIRGADLTPERAAEIRTVLDGMTSEDPEEKKLLKKARTSLTIVTRKNNWPGACQDAGITKEQVEERIANLDQALAGMSQEQRVAYIDTLEVQAKAFGVELPKTDPKGSETVNTTDAAETGKSGTLPAYIQNSEVQAFMVDAAEGQAFVKALGTLEAAYNGIEETCRWMARLAIQSLLETLGAGENLAAYKKQILGDESSPDTVIAKSDIRDMEDTIASLEAELQKVSSSNQALFSSNKNMVNEQKQILARALVIYSVAAGEKGYQGLDANQIQGEISRKASKSLLSLSDAMEEILEKKLPGFVIEAGSHQQSEGVKEIKDAAVLEDQQKEGTLQETEVPGTAETLVYGSARLPIRDRKTVMALRRAAAAQRFRK